MARLKFLLLIILFFYSLILFAQKHYLHIGQTPPELSYLALNSSKEISINSKDMKGNVYLVDFWATWCAPCIEFIPHIDSLVDEFKGQKVKFISITYEPKDYAAKFLKKHPLHSEVGIDTSFAMFRNYNAWAIPNIVMINSKGIIAGRIYPGRLNKAVIDVLLKGGVPAVKNTPENLYKAEGAEAYFRSLLKKKK